MEWLGFAVIVATAVVWIVDSTDLVKGPSQRRPVVPATTPSLPRPRGPRRPRISGAYPGWWGDLLRQHGYQCVYCGIRGSRRLRLHKEHVVPLARGGRHHIDNIRPACPRCNLIKGTLTGDEFHELIRSNGGVVPLSRRLPKIAEKRPAPQRQLVLQAVARLQAGGGAEDSWSAEDIAREIWAAGATAPLSSIRAVVSTMGTEELLVRVQRGRYRLP